ncbi:MAG: hypothetical protein FWH35_08345 [Treponema sp.]|nr:hypothetical protein [Treponema sp.]
MNCFNHAEVAAVASCIDCGKGLCKECSSLYQIPICNECNLKRVKADKGNIVKVYLPSILLFIICLVIGIANGKVALGIFFGWISAGVPWGWKAVTFIQPRMFLFLSFFGWLIYFIIKFALAYFIGIVAFPIGIVKMILSIVSAKKKEENIKNNLNGQE